MSHKIQYSISPIAAAVSAALAAPGAALAQEDGASSVLDEIIVTATKREMNLQNVGSSVQALPEAMLRELGALNTEEYVRFMPDVNWINFNAGSNAVIFRGINTTTSGFIAPQSSSVYLDEIPVTSTAGNSPNIRMMDVARVEALIGPQGTLFGSAAQAGILRVITNQPDPSHFEAKAEAMVRSGATSDVSHSVEGMINIPLVEDVFAIRLAVQSAEDGGYIDNVQGHMPDTWFGETAAQSAAADANNCNTAAWGRNWGCDRLAWGSHQNTDVAEENWNTVEHLALRISARWDMNEDWSATLAYHYGSSEGQASSAYNPFVGDLQTIGFRKDHSTNEWSMTALTIEADLGFAQFVSATSFYENQRDFSNDATMYFRYYMTYYCEDAGPSDPMNPATGYYWDNPVTGRIMTGARYCPMALSDTGVRTVPEIVGVVSGPEWQDRFSQEFRLTHQGETFDWLAGLYYEDSNDSWDAVWMASQTPYNESVSFAWMEERQPGSHPAGFTPTHHWDSRDRTDWEQKAVFGEVTWHATDALSVTVGGRYSETENTKVYNKLQEGGTGPDGRRTGTWQQDFWAGNELPQTGNVEDFVPKFGLTYNLDDDKMLYGLYTVGYRTGGINRANRRADWDVTVFGQTWEPDKLNNYELGLKSRWADNTVQLNMALFYMDWQDFLTEVVDPSSNECIPPAVEPCLTSERQPWLSIVGNSGEAHASGVSVELDWIPADGWTVAANARFLEAEIDKEPPQKEGAASTGIVPGLRLPNIPEFQASAWATYTWPVQFAPGAEMFLTATIAHTGDSVTKLVPSDEGSASPSFINEAYTLGNIRLGLISDDGWQIDVFVDNVTDERPMLSQGCCSGWQWGRTGEYERDHDVFTSRPREYGIRFSTRWGD